MQQLVGDVLGALVGGEGRRLNEGPVECLQALAAPPLPLEVLPDEVEHPDEGLLPALAVHRQRHVLGVEVRQQLLTVARVVAVDAPDQVLQDLHVLRDAAVADRRRQPVGALRSRGDAR